MKPTADAVHCVLAVELYTRYTFMCVCAVKGAMKTSEDGEYVPVR